MDTIGTVNDILASYNRKANWSPLINLLLLVFKPRNQYFERGIATAPIGYKCCFSHAPIFLQHFT